MKFAALAPDVQQEIMRLYYETDTPVSEIMETFQLEGSASRLYEKFPNTPSTECCPYCGIPMECKPQSRENKRFFGTAGLKPTMICPRCGHIANSFMCTCPGCQQKREREWEEREAAEKQRKQALREAIYDAYDVPHTQYPWEKITFMDQVLLATVCRYAMAEDLSYIVPLDTAQRQHQYDMTPTETSRLNTIECLYQQGYISVRPESPLDAFVLDENGQLTSRVYIYRVAWNINVPELHQKPFLQAVLWGDMIKKSLYVEDVLYIWFRVALAECLQYYTLRLNRLDIDPIIGKKTKACFTQLAQNFSVGQVLFFIYKTAKNVAFRIQEGQYKRQAANTMIGDLLRTSERYVTNHWDIPVYTWPWECPESEWAAFFYTQILGLGDAARQQVPNAKTLEALGFPSFLQDSETETEEQGGTKHEKTE